MLRNKNTIWILLLWSSIQEDFSDTSRPMSFSNLCHRTTKPVCFSVWGQLQPWCVLASIYTYIHTCTVVTARVSFSMLGETSHPAPLVLRRCSSLTGGETKERHLFTQPFCCGWQAGESQRLSNPKWLLKEMFVFLRSDSGQVAEKGKKAAMTTTVEVSSAGSGGKGVYFLVFLSSSINPTSTHLVG